MKLLDPQKTGLEKIGPRQILAATILVAILFGIWWMKGNPKERPLLPPPDQYAPRKEAPSTPPLFQPQPENPKLRPPAKLFRVGQEQPRPGAGSMPRPSSSFPSVNLPTFEEELRERPAPLKADEFRQQVVADTRKMLLEAAAARDTSAAPQITEAPTKQDVVGSFLWTAVVQTQITHSIPGLVRLAGVQGRGRHWGLSEPFEIACTAAPAQNGSQRIECDLEGRGAVGSGPAVVHRYVWRTIGNALLRGVSTGLVSLGRDQVGTFAPQMESGSINLDTTPSVLFEPGTVIQLLGPDPAIFAR